MNSQFTPIVTQILAFSREEASRLASRTVAPEHLLLGLMRMKDGPVADIFERLKLNRQSVKSALEQRVRNDNIENPIYPNDLVLNEQANNVLRLAVLEARIQHTPQVDQQHLLLALLHDQAMNGARQVLEEQNMNYEQILNMLHAPQESGVQNGIGLPEDEEEDYEQTANSQQNTNTQQATAKRKDSKTPVLDNFGTDLTKAAAEGKLDPCVGREREIQRVVEILGRRKKITPY